MKYRLRIVLGLILAAGMTPSLAGQAQPYPAGDLKKTYERLLKQIDAIPMYDNHAHPGFSDDTDVDAMASPPDESSTLRLRDDNPEFVAAAQKPSSGTHTMTSSPSTRNGWWRKRRPPSKPLASRTSTAF